jgi:ribosome-associated protein
MPTEDDLLGEVGFEYCRAPGPGGQNVNKVATAVRLRWDLAATRLLPPPVKARLVRLAGARVTGGEILLIEAHRHRTRETNRRDALDRLLRLVERAWPEPVPRRATRPSAASRRRRIREKRVRGELKTLRGRPPASPEE